MANPEHVELLEAGTQAIATWRAANSTTILDLVDATLWGLDLAAADLSLADLRWASLKGAKLLGANLQGVNASEANFLETDLSHADLTNAQLKFAFLQDTILVDTRLRKANLTGAFLSYAKMARADLTDAFLESAILERADLSNANFTRANLIGCNFTKAMLREINLNLAVLGETILCDVDLLSATYLETCHHEGPSYIATATLARLGGQIDESIEQFLRGSGLLQWEVETARLYGRSQPADVSGRVVGLLHGDPLTLSNHFVSYSHVDFEPTVRRIYQRLKSLDINVYIDRVDLVAGGLQRQVAAEISRRDSVIVVLSRNSIESDWVENEVDLARRREREEGKDILCPIALDNAWQSKLDESEPRRDLWQFLQQKVVLDFSDDAEFDGQFQKLVEGLRRHYSGPPDDED